MFLNNTHIPKIRNNTIQFSFNMCMSCIAFSLTQVWANIWDLHHNEEYWTDPYEFVPERFLDEEGELVPSDHINRKRCDN